MVCETACLIWTGEESLPKEEVYHQVGNTDGIKMLNTPQDLMAQLVCRKSKRAVGK